MNKCRYCMTTHALHRHVVWLNKGITIDHYCEKCWQKKHREGWGEKTFEEFEEIYNRDDSRLFNDLESAQLFVAKESL